MAAQLEAVQRHLERHLLESDGSESLRRSEFRLELDVATLGFLSGRIHAFVEIAASVDDQRKRATLLEHALKGFTEEGIVKIKWMLSLVARLKIDPTPKRFRPPQEPIDLALMESLRVLEIANVDLKWIRGLGAVRPFLKKLAITADLKEIQKALLSDQTQEDESTPWKALRTLKLPNNHISMTDESLFLLANVENVDLSNNQIEQIRNFQRCYALRVLNLAFNRISNVSDIYLHLGNVSTLILRHNKIQSANGLERLVALEKLDLSYNQISCFSELKSLASLPLLKELWLEMNPIALKRGYRMQVSRIFKTRNSSKLERTFKLDDQSLVWNGSESLQSSPSIPRRQSLIKSPFRNSNKGVRARSRPKARIAQIQDASALTTTVVPKSEVSEISVDDEVANTFEKYENALRSQGKMWLAVLTGKESSVKDLHLEQTSNRQESIASNLHEESQTSFVSSEEESINQTGGSSSLKLTTPSDAELVSGLSSDLLSSVKATNEENYVQSDSFEGIHMNRRARTLTTEEAMEKFQCLATVNDERLLVSIWNGFVVEQDILTQKTKNEFRIVDVSRVSKVKDDPSKLLLSLEFASGKTCMYELDDAELFNDFFQLFDYKKSDDLQVNYRQEKKDSMLVVESTECSTLLQDHQVEPDNHQIGPPGIEAHDEDEQAVVISQNRQSVVIFADYFSDDNSLVQSSMASASTRAPPSDDDFIKFLSEYRAKKNRNSNGASDALWFEVPVLALTKLSEEQVMLILITKNRIYFVEKDQLETSSMDLTFTFLITKDITSITSLTLGLFLRHLRVDFVDKSSYLLLTRNKEVTSEIVQALVQIAHYEPLQICNNDRFTLDCIQSQVLGGDSDDSFRMYELIFEVKSSQKIPRTLIVTEKRLFLCNENHSFSKHGSSIDTEISSPDSSVYSKLFVIVAAEKRKDLISIDFKSVKALGKFSLEFGTKKAFGTANPKRIWALAANHDVTIDSIAGELQRKVE